MSKAKDIKDFVVDFINITNPNLKATISDIDWNAEDSKNALKLMESYHQSQLKDKIEEIKGYAKTDELNDWNNAFESATKRAIKILKK